MNENKKALHNQLTQLIGKRVTIVKFGEMGFLQNIKAEIKEVLIKDYAQYRDMIHIHYRPHKKRITYVFRIYDHTRMLIWEDYKKVQTDMYVKSSVDANGTSIKSSLLSFDSQYLQIAKDSVKEQPIIEIKPNENND